MRLQPATRSEAVTHLAKRRAAPRSYSIPCVDKVLHKRSNPAILKDTEGSKSQVEPRQNVGSLNIGPRYKCSPSPKEKESNDPLIGSKRSILNTPGVLPKKKDKKSSSNDTESPSSPMEDMV